MKLHMNLGEHSYDIILERGCLAKLNEYADLSHKALIISDDNVPQKYIDKIAAVFILQSYLDSLQVHL